MKHAGADTLTVLDPLLALLRKRRGLVERTPGSFYSKSKAFLHFHEDSSGIYADVKLDPPGFTRLRVSTPAERAKLLALLEERLAS